MGHAPPAAVVKYFDWFKMWHGYSEFWLFPSAESGKLAASTFFQTLIQDFDDLIAGKT
jgi:hypothetical protein